MTPCFSSEQELPTRTALEEKVRAASSVIMDVASLSHQLGREGFFEETSEQVRAKQVASTHWSLLLAQRWELCTMPSCWSFYFAGSDIFPPPHCTAKHLFKGPFPLLWHSAQQLWLIKGTACARENGGSSR